VHIRALTDRMRTAVAKSLPRAGLPPDAALNELDAGSLECLHDGFLVRAHQLRRLVALKACNAALRNFGRRCKLRLPPSQQGSGSAALIGSDEGRLVHAWECDSDAGYMQRCGLR
jgi:hypothetical protein